MERYIIDTKEFLEKTFLFKILQIINICLMIFLLFVYTNSTHKNNALLLCGILFVIVMFIFLKIECGRWDIDSEVFCSEEEIDFILRDNVPQHEIENKLVKKITKFKITKIKKVEEDESNDTLIFYGEVIKVRNDDKIKKSKKIKVYIKDKEIRKIFVNKYNRGLK